MTRHTVLLIEQDLALQLLYGEVLRSAGYEVCELTHDDDIVAAANSAQPTVALISGGRSGLFRAGWRAAQQLGEAQPDLPLVMIATNTAAVQEVGQTARGRAFAAALQKPFQLDELLRVVAQVTSSSMARAAIHGGHSRLATDR